MLLSFECLTIWYIQSFHPNDVKCTVFTKADMRMLYINFLSDWRILPMQYNFILN